LSFKQKSAYKVIAARVVSRAADSWSCVLIIDKGRHQGIGRNMVVINYLGLVGRVAEAGQFSSKVMLMNDANFAVSGILQRSRQEGVVCGTMGQYLVMRYLPKECDVRVSDTVVTSGLTANYPKGLLVGTVIDVQEEFSGLSRLAIVKPAVDFSALEEVLVIIP
jgi:rod shape-determining protein MreC